MSRITIDDYIYEECDSVDNSIDFKMQFCPECGARLVETTGSIKHPSYTCVSCGEVFTGLSIQDYV